MAKKTIRPPSRIQTGAVIEEFSRRMAAVLDAVTAARTETQGLFLKLEDRWNPRFEAIEHCVRELVGDVRELKGDVAELKLGQARLERGLDEVKLQLSDVVSIVSRHETQIASLWSAQRPAPA